MKKPSLFLSVLLASLWLVGCMGVSVPLPRHRDSRPVVLNTLPPQPTRIVTLILNTTATTITTPTTPAADNPELAALLAMPVTELTAGGDGMVNLRSGPGAIYDIIARVDTGTKLSAIAITEHGEWLVLRHPTDLHQVAWVYIAYTDYDPARQKLPIIHNLPPTPTPSGG